MYNTTVVKAFLYAADVTSKILLHPSLEAADNEKLIRELKLRLDLVFKLLLAATPVFPVDRLIFAFAPLYRASGIGIGLPIGLVGTIGDEMLMLKLTLS